MPPHASAISATEAAFFFPTFFSGFRDHGAHEAHVHHVSGSPDPETDPLSDAKGPDILVARSAELRRGLESGLR